MLEPVYSATDIYEVERMPTLLARFTIFLGRVYFYN